MNGKVILIGAGPGDPGLLTLKGKKALENADVVLSDRLVGDGITEMIPKGTQKIYVGKHAGQKSISQSEINELMLSLAFSGKNVVRLKGGDSFIFGRGGEETDILKKHGIPFEVVPGITSAVAAPEAAGIPITYRGVSRSVHIVTARTENGMNDELDFERYARIGGTVVILMGISALREIAYGFVRAGMDEKTPCAVIENGSLPSQRIARGVLSDIADRAACMKSPSVVVIGEVCDAAFDRSSTLPLAGTGVAVTAHIPEFEAELSLSGASVTACPCIRTEAIRDEGMGAKVVKEAEDADIVAFTSAAGVDHCVDMLLDSGFDVRCLHGKVAAVGEGTSKALRRRGICADMIPEIHCGAALGDMMVSERPKKVLLLRAEDADNAICIKLSEHGIVYSDIALYKTVGECGRDITDEINSGRVRYVTFMSASAVRAFYERHKEADNNAYHAVCIGNSTAREAARYGMRILVSERTDIPDMAETIIRAEKERRI